MHACTLVLSLGHVQVLRAVVFLINHQGLAVHIKCFSVLSLLIVDGPNV